MKPITISELEHLIEQVDGTLAELGPEAVGPGKHHLAINLRLAREQLETKLIKLGGFVKGLESARTEAHIARKETEQALGRLRQHLSRFGHL